MELHHGFTMSRLRNLLIAFAVFTATPAAAQSTTVSVWAALFYGTGFNAVELGLNSPRNQVGTFLVDWNLRHPRGDQDVEIRLFGAPFDTTGARPSGEQIRAYAEWNTRTRLTQWRNPARGTSLELSAATEVIRASMWRGNEYAGIALTRRTSSTFARMTAFYLIPLETKAAMRLRFNWSVPVTIGSMALNLDGSESLVRHADGTMDLLGLPSLVADAGRLIRMRPGVFWVGAELIHHDRSNHHRVASQLTFRWTQ